MNWVGDVTYARAAGLPFRHWWLSMEASAAIVAAVFHIEPDRSDCRSPLSLPATTVGVRLGRHRRLRKLLSRPSLHHSRQTADAVEVGELALAVFEARGNLWWAGRTLGHLTWAANALGEWEASLSYCRRALEHGIALQDVRLKTIGWWRMASASVQQGDLKLGFECCNEALALAAIPYDIAMARAIRGYALIRAGQVDAGMAELRESAEWFESAHLRR